MNYEMFCEIKHLHQREKLNPNQIAKKLGIDPKTVRSQLSKERFEQAKPRRKGSILDPYKQELNSLLSRHDYSAVQVFDRIVEEGYSGGISTVRNYVATVRPPPKTPYLTLCFEPGSAAQVDFGYCGYLQFDNVRRRFYLFAMVLCYSRMLYVEFIMKQNMEHFLACQRHAFEYFSGVPRTVIVDNCKVAISKHSAYERAIVNPHYQDFAGHYGFDVRACGVRKPHEKGQVEKAIDYCRRNFLNGLEIPNLTALNHAVRHWLDNTANVRIHSYTKKRPKDLFNSEKAALIQLPLHPYDCASIKQVKSNKQFRVLFEGNRYSVPAEYASSPLAMKVYPERVSIFADDKLIAKHTRCFDNGRDFESPDHVKELLDKKRRAKDQQLLKHFLMLSPKAEAYYYGLKNKRLNTNNHIRKILALIDIYDKDKVIRALEDTLDYDAFGSDYITNLLEQQSRTIPKAAPLHLTRKTDLLDIELGEVDLTIYNRFITKKEQNNGKEN